MDVIWLVIGIAIGVVAGVGSCAIAYYACIRTSSNNYVASAAADGDSSGEGANGVVLAKPRSGGYDVDVATPKGGTVIGHARIASNGLPRPFVRYDTYRATNTRIAHENATKEDEDYDKWALTRNPWSYEVNPHRREGQGGTGGTGAQNSPRKVDGSGGGPSARGAGGAEEVSPRLVLVPTAGTPANTSKTLGAVSVSNAASAGAGGSGTPKPEQKLVPSSARPSSGRIGELALVPRSSVVGLAAAALGAKLSPRDRDGKAKTESDLILNKSNADEYIKINPVYAFRVDSPVLVDKVWGQSVAAKGDFVIVGKNGDIYCAKESVFLETYERIPGEEFAFRKMDKTLAKRVWGITPTAVNSGRGSVVGATANTTGSGGHSGGGGGSSTIHIKTDNGWERVTPGDWLIQDSNGRQKLLTPAAFYENYEKVDAHSKGESEELKKTSLFQQSVQHSVRRVVKTMYVCGSLAFALIHSLSHIHLI